MFETRSVTTERHEQMLNKLPGYADMSEFIQALRLAANIPGSMMHNLNNLQTVLEQAAKLVTCTTLGEKEDAEAILYKTLV